MLHSLYLLVLLAVSSVTQSSGTDNPKMRPRITSLTNRTISVNTETQFQITCKANCSWESFHLIYWLVNSSFVEDLYPDGRVSESTPRNYGRIADR
ncbi:interleukin-18-binding protein isoform X2 [Ambystoma mexicanum]|uniref:interleukin-18-binding protein isoform X2 n=1 Tax=Ambystoma mexicanum TaxID=8296 RepID=UPI0037E7BADE